MNSDVRGDQAQSFLDADFPLGDPKGSLGFAGWLDSYMDEIMVGNNIMPGPQGPSFATARPIREEEIPFGLDLAAGPPIVSGGAQNFLSADANQEFALDLADRSGSSNSADSRPELQQQGGSLSKAAAKALAVAEKNRKAQKRFRERQKNKMMDSQKQVEELSAKLALVMQEKNKLETRNSVLEKVVRLKEEQIATMESRSVEPTKITADGTPIAQEELFELLFTFSNVVKRGAFVREEETVKAVPLSKIQERHKEWIEEVAKALMEGAEDPFTQAHGRMNELVAVMRETTTRLGVLNDRLMMTICSTTIVPDPTAPVPDINYWRRVLEATSLSQEQKVKVRHIHYELLKKMETILQERQSIINSLQGRQVPESPKDMFSLNQAGRFLEQTSTLEALQRNMKAEYQVVFDFELAFYHTVLLPIQQAKMSVQAYPWPTDTLAICCLILEEIGEMQPEKGQSAIPSTQDLLQRVTGSSPFLSLAGARANTHVPTA
eukprot:jgi/Botrbrau1/1244/Bobra.0163s0037.1